MGYERPDLINQSANAIASASNFKLQSSIKMRCIKRSTGVPEVLRDGWLRKDISILDHTEAISFLSRSDLELRLELVVSFAESAPSMA